MRQQSFCSWLITKCDESFMIPSRRVGFQSLTLSSIDLNSRVELFYLSVEVVLTNIKNQLILKLRVSLQPIQT